MNKEINYLIEYLAKSGDTFYKDILDFFALNDIYTPTKYDSKTVKLLSKKSGYEICDAQNQLDDRLKQELDIKLVESKQKLFRTLVESNFKKKVEEFDKVETSIYKCIRLYIVGLTRGFELFLVYTRSSQQTPEVFIDFANTLHVKLLESIFNPEEKALLDDKLKEIMSVYLALYAQNLYTS